MNTRQKIALGLGSRLLIGSVATVLPTFQFGCFVLGLILFNYVIITKKN